jgi:beta-galactosidase/beta-glucuronidase
MLAVIRFGALASLAVLLPWGMSTGAWTPDFSRRPKAAACSAFPVPAAYPPPRRSAPTNTLARHGRATQALDGTWQFQTDPDNKGEQTGWTRAAPASAKDITIPSLWNKSAAPDYTGVAWYWRVFETPATWKGQTIRLHFGAAADKAQVWLNGQPLGAHTGGTIPFEFTITSQVHIGEKNTLAVRVEGNAKTGAGLWRNVLLLAHDEAYITDCFAQGDGLGNLNAAVTLLNTSEHSGDAELDGRIVADNTPDKEVLSTHQNLGVTPGRNLTIMLLNGASKHVQCWSPATPFLYRVQLSFRQDKDILDTLETTFGFRQFGQKDGTLTLNGEPLQLTAGAPYPPSPIVLATPEEMERARETMRHLRESGVTLLYMEAPPPLLLGIADGEGLLVVEGPSPHQTPQAAAEEMHALILRDRSHPCILAWDLRDTSVETATSTRQLDATRFLLVGPADALKLWLPNQNAASAIVPPSGFLPAS